MAQNRIRPIMGPSEEHLRGTPLGSGQHRIPILHFVLPDNGLQSLRAKLTLASLYAMGMALSSLYLAYGREADSVNEDLHEPVSLISGVYFPSTGGFSPFPLAVQAGASLIPLTLGMDALRKTLFFGQGFGEFYLDLERLALAVMGVALLLASSKALKFLENKGRRTGTIAVRQR